MQLRRMRVLRGFVAAAVATFAAAASHGLADGAVPSAFALIIAFTAAVFVCVALAGRGMSLFRLALSVAASQTIYHALFVFVPSTSGTVSGNGHHHGSGATLIMQVDAAAAGHLHAPNGWMLAAHVIAAIVTVAAVRHGERAVLNIFSAMRLGVLALIGELLVLVPALEPKRQVSGHAIRLPALARPLLSSMRHRGPPAFA